MLLGKRSRSPMPMRRTASLKDVSAEGGPPPSDQEIPATVDGKHQQQRLRNGPDSKASVSTEIVSPLRTGRGAGDLLPAAASMKASPILRDCALCKSYLLPARDIFMYRGSAFCSLKCRQQLINHDAREEKLKLFLFSMKKKISDQANSQASKPSGEGEETMAAA